MKFLSLTVGAVTLALFLTACEDDPVAADKKPIPPSVAQSTQPPNEGPVDALVRRVRACSLVTESDMERAIGQDVSLMGDDPAHPATRESSCHYGLAKHVPPVPVIRVVTILDNPSQSTWKNRVKTAMATGSYREVKGVGEGAYKGNEVWLATHKGRLIISFEKIGHSYQIDQKIFPGLAQTAMKRYAAK